MATSKLGNVRIIPYHPDHARTLLAQVARPEWLVSTVDDLQYLTRGIGVTVIKDAQVFCSMGITHIWPGFGEAWLLPSPLVTRSPLLLSRLCRRGLEAVARAGQYHRVQATTLSPDGRRFLRHLGFQYECTLAKAGPHQEPVDIYVRFYPWLLPSSPVLPSSAPS